METPSRFTFSPDGSTRVFQIPVRMKGDNYVRIEVDGAAITDRNKFDLVNNAVVFVDAVDVPNGSQLDVLVVQTDEGISNLGSVFAVDIVAANITAVNNVNNNLTAVQNAVDNANAAAASAAAASASEASASSSASSASSSASAASASASSAATDAATATTKAGEAATSAATANTQAQLAAISASNASDSATAASSSATSAASSATTAANTLSNSAKLNENNTWVKAQQGNTLDTVSTGNTALDFDTYQNFTITLSGDITLTNPTTGAEGQSGFIMIKQDGTGGRTVSLASNFKTVGGAGLSLSSGANEYDLVPYAFVGSTTILLGVPQRGFTYV